MFLSLLPRTLLLPPVAFLLVALAAALLRRRFLLWVALLALLALAMPIVPRLLMAGLEDGIRLETPAPDSPNASRAPPRAIIVLGADASFPAVDGGILAIPRPGRLTLERLWAGAVLQSRTGLPLLVSGGIVRPGRPSLAAMMADTLATGFQSKATWLETRSTDTWGNAEYSAALLAESGIRSAYVVSHAWHLRRARIAFAHFGVTVWPAPIGRTAFGAITAADFMPGVEAWLDSYYALHEWVGCAVYALRG